ncbi:MAG: ATP-binding protein [Candidatus Faecousia sp.]|nr:ATP-binding protein [Bacillota bacterium]MDY4219208.1 ATP-binding protein [Candidatus Faecousia sp.]
MGRKPGKKGERASRKKKNKGLRGRWLTHTVGPVSILAAVCVVIITACFAVYYYSNMQADLSHRAKTTTEFFANYIGQSYNEYYQSCISYARSFEDKNTIELQFISTGGRIVASSYGQWAGKNPTTPDVQNAMDTQKIASYLGRDPATGERIMAVSSPMIYRNGEVIGVLRYVTSMKLVDRQLAFAALIALGAGALFVLVVIISSSFYIRSILEPVAEITATAKRIAGGSYGVQIKSQYDDEIGELAQTINDMSNKINQNEKLQTEFISSLSHELRTPLTAISGWSETLLSGDALDPEETRRGIAIIQRESRRLTEMVTELLDFTRMEDGRMTLNVEMTDLRAEFEDTVYMYGSRLRQEGIALRVLDNDDDIPEIPCDPKRMRQVLLNILDNAAKHGGEGKVIEASMALEGENIVIRIRDYGPGIPEDELPLVKKKFFKGSSKARGSGIGLAVCDEIVEMHGGRLDLENAPGGGTLVTIRIPAAEQ